MPSVQLHTSPAPPADQPAGRPIPEHPMAALYPAEASFLTGKSLRTLEAERLKGGGIPFLKVGRAVRYLRGDVDRWVTASRRTSTTDPGSPSCERRSQGQKAEG